MIKIEATVHPLKLDSIKQALAGLRIGGITISYVLDHGGAHGLKTFYRGAEYYVDMPRVKLEMLVSSLQVDEVIEVLLEAARTSELGDQDGTILVTDIADAFSVRTGKRVHVTIA